MVPNTGWCISKWSIVILRKEDRGGRWWCRCVTVHQINLGLVSEPIAKLRRYSVYHLATLGSQRKRERKAVERRRDIGVIYVRGVPVPVPTIFQDEKVKNLLSPAVNKSDLWILNYDKTIFGRGSARTPWESFNLHPQSRMRRGYFLSIFLPFRFGTQEPHSFSELVPPLFRPKYYAPAYRDGRSVFSSFRQGLRFKSK